MDPQDGLYDNKGSQVLVVVILFPILAVIAVALRLYTRIRIVAHPAVDDIFAVVGLVFSIATSICMVFQVHFGMGRHMATLTPAEGLGSLKALFASIINYNFALLFIKLSILLQYLRICNSPMVRRACHGVIAYVIMYGVECFFTGTFTCFPVSKFWNTELPGHCMNQYPLWFTNGGLNIVGDFMILVLPVFILDGVMFLNTRKRIVLMLLLGLGGFACIASIIRLRALYVMSKSTDIAWADPGTAIWSALELNIALICSCLGTLKPFAARFFPGLLNLSLSRSRAGKHPYNRSLNTPRSKGGVVEIVDMGEDERRKINNRTPESAGPDKSTSGELYAIQQPDSAFHDERTYRDERDDFSP